MQEVYREGSSNFFGNPLCIVLKRKEGWNKGRNEIERNEEGQKINRKKDGKKIRKEGRMEVRKWQ
jgi:hypothetical protein